ncbi:MAG: hypothetical protein KF754_11355 [Planctomycetes bacterium]|nr:hypothetical protein [Planctomycetota bacterium]
MAEDDPKPSRRFPRAGWAAVGLIVLLLASPLLVELWRQHDIASARDEYRRALRETSQPWAHITDWDAWYRANVPYGEGQKGFARLRVEAMALEDEYEAKGDCETGDIRTWLRTGAVPDPAGFSQHRVDSYLADSEELSRSALLLLSHSQLLGPPAESLRASVIPVISVFSVLERRALFLAWNGQHAEALEVCRQGLELAQRLLPLSNWNDVFAVVAARHQMFKVAGLLISAIPTGPAAANWPEHLLTDFALDETLVLELELHSHARYAAAPDDALTEHVAMWDWPGSLTRFGWFGLDLGMEQRQEKFEFAADYFRWLRDDTYLLESNWNALRRGESVSNQQACSRLRQVRCFARIDKLHARRARAALALRIQDAAGQPLTLEAAKFPLLRLKEQDGATYLLLEPDAAVLSQLGMDPNSFESEFEPIRFQRTR